MNATPQAPLYIKFVDSRENLPLSPYLTKNDVQRIYPALTLANTDHHDDKDDSSTVFHCTLSKECFGLIDGYLISKVHNIPLNDTELPFVTDLESFFSFTEYISNEDDALELIKMAMQHEVDIKNPTWLRMKKETLERIISGEKNHQLVIMWLGSIANSWPKHVTDTYWNVIKEITLTQTPAMVEGYSLNLDVTKLQNGHLKLYHAIQNQVIRMDVTVNFADDLDVKTTFCQFLLSLKNLQVLEFTSPQSMDKRGIFGALSQLRHENLKCVLFDKSLGFLTPNGKIRSTFETDAKYASSYDYIRYYAVKKGEIYQTKHLTTWIERKNY